MRNAQTVINLITLATIVIIMLMAFPGCSPSIEEQADMICKQPEHQTVLCDDMRVAQGILRDPSIRRYPAIRREAQMNITRHAREIIRRDSLRAEWLLRGVTFGHNDTPVVALETLD